MFCKHLFDLCLKMTRKKPARDEPRSTVLDLLFLVPTHCQHPIRGNTCVSLHVSLHAVNTPRATSRDLSPMDLGPNRKLLSCFPVRSSPGRLSHRAKVQWSNLWLGLSLQLPSTGHAFLLCGSLARSGTTMVILATTVQYSATCPLAIRGCRGRCRDVL